MRSLLLVFVLALTAEGASAQKPPTPPQRKAAKAHFDQGRAFYDAGAWSDAVREYEQAFAIVPLPELLFNIGQAYRMHGDKLKAIEAYRRYLDRMPDGPLAEDARNHVAALGLRIQVEEAEAARRKAIDGEAAARKEAAEAEAARRRAEAEAAARAQARVEDEARLRRVAVEEAERARRAKEAAEAAREEADRAGRGLRIAGWPLVILGTLGVAGAIGLGQGVRSNYDQTQEFNSDPRAVWSGELDDHVSSARGLQKVVLGLSIGGGVLLGSGVSMLIVAAVKRSRAVERLGPQLSLIPALGPSTGTLVLAGGF
jgi:tetratricopeptide (TPR) repeat protein